ncbi:hypothetical protein AB0J28_15470 [Streptosporangium canum]|uniref:hypothetical protein n=1 Tax=Streptosporangium canum TaxID=324952 RepID=UPI003438CA12
MLGGQAGLARPGDGQFPFCSGDPPFGAGHLPAAILIEAERPEVRLGSLACFELPHPLAHHCDPLPFGLDFPGSPVLSCLQPRFGDRHGIGSHRTRSHVIAAGRGRLQERAFLGSRGLGVQAPRSLFCDHLGQCPLDPTFSFPPSLRLPWCFLGVLARPERGVLARILFRGSREDLIYLLLQPLPSAGGFLRRVRGDLRAVHGDEVQPPQSGLRADQQRQQYPRTVGATAGTALGIARLQRRDVQVLDHLKQHSHRMIVGQPLAHIHRQQELLISINPSETPRHLPIQRSPGW